MAVVVPIMDYEAMVQDGELPQELAQEIASVAKMQRAHSKLTDHLREIHERMPDVSEEEADRDIAEAIQAVRAERRREHEQRAND